MRPALLVRVTTADGVVVVGEVQGLGGVVRHRRHLERALRRLARGKSLDALHEPTPGRALVYPAGHATSRAPVEPRVVDLRGARVEVVS